MASASKDWLLKTRSARAMSDARGEHDIAPDKFPIWRQRCRVFASPRIPKVQARETSELIADYFPFRQRTCGGQTTSDQHVAIRMKVLEK